MDVEREIAKLNEAVDHFAEVMKERLAEKARDGYSGWDNPTYAVQSEIRQALFEDAEKVNYTTAWYEKPQLYIDIANRAMMNYRAYEILRGASE